MSRTWKAILLLELTLAAAGSADDRKQPQHRTCQSCHVAAYVPIASESAQQRFSYRVCLTCHDGQIADEPNPTLHLAHNHIDKKEGLKCTVCHDPHDRTGSYCMLKGKRGPQTETTAVLDFCRECHADH